MRVRVSSAHLHQPETGLDPGSRHSNTETDKKPRSKSLAIREADQWPAACFASPLDGSDANIIKDLNLRYLREALQKATLEIEVLGHTGHFRCLQREVCGGEVYPRVGYAVPYLRRR